MLSPRESESSPSAPSAWRESRGSDGRYFASSEPSRYRLSTYSFQSAPARRPRKRTYSQPGRNESSHTANSVSDRNAQPWPVDVSGMSPRVSTATSTTAPTRMFIRMAAVARSIQPLGNHACLPSHTHSRFTRSDASVGGGEMTCIPLIGQPHLLVLRRRQDVLDYGQRRHMCCVIPAPRLDSNQ